VVVAYLVAGLTFSVAVGVPVVAIFHGAGIDYRGTDVYSVIGLLGGVAALGFAVGVGTGRRQPPTGDEGGGKGSATIRRLRDPSVTTSADTAAYDRAINIWTTGPEACAGTPSAEQDPQWLAWDTAATCDPAEPPNRMRSGTSASRGRRRLRRAGLAPASDEPRAC
jgi:hypothetical protein